MNLTGTRDAWAWQQSLRSERMFETIKTLVQPFFNPSLEKQPYHSVADLPVADVWLRRRSRKVRHGGPPSILPSRAVPNFSLYFSW